MYLTPAISKMGNANASQKDADRAARIRIAGYITITAAR